MIRNIYLLFLGAGWEEQMASLFSRQLCVTSESLLMPTSVCQLASSNCPELLCCFATASQHSVGYLFHLLFLRRWLLHSCCLNLICSSWQFTLPSSVCSQCQLLGWLPVFDDLTTSQTRALERVKLKLAVIIYCPLHGMAPQYLSELLHYITNIPSRRHLRSCTSDDLFVPSLRLVSVGDRSFAAAAPRLWNTLPDDITSAPSLSVCRHKRKTFLLQKSYPDIYSLFCCWFFRVAPRWCWSFILYLGHLK